MNHADKRKDFMRDQKARRIVPSRVGRTLVNDSGDHPPSDAEFERVAAEYGPCPREAVKIWGNGHGFTVQVGAKRWRYMKWGQYAGRSHEYRDPRTKVYAAGQTTTAVYDPKTKAPYVFKTGDARSQKAEIRAVMNTPEWKEAHKLPEDMEVNITE